MVLFLISLAEGVFRENFKEDHGTFSYFIRGGSENFFRKGGGSSEKISKRTIILFCSFILRGGGWVVNLTNLEKSAHVQ